MPSSETVTRAPSRRDQHKTRTREALRKAALELFASQGYDTTTTEEIAERAGVSVRTFFRYFPTKEMVLFLGRYDAIQVFADALRGQPASASDLESMRAAFMTPTPEFAQRRKALLLYEKAVASSPTLRGIEQDRYAEDVRTLAKAISERHGLARPDERCALLAAIGLLANRRALGRWLAGPATGDFGAVVSEEFDLLDSLYT
jgi:AcrR family transcriptional regulator